MESCGGMFRSLRYVGPETDSASMHKTLLLSLVLALLELIIWLSIGVFASWSSGDLRAALISYSAESFGEITMAIATTFYVVFTYGLLANSEAQRKHSTEPHLVMRWRQAAEGTDTRLSKMGLFGEKARSVLSEAVALGGNAIDETDLATGNRYLILELTNPRNTPVGWLDLAVSGRLEIPHTNPVLFDDKLYLKDLHIGSEDKMEITMIDLFPIPQTAKVTLTIDVMTYGAIDGGNVLDKTSGDVKKTASGEFLLRQTKGPQPD